MTALLTKPCLSRVGMNACSFLVSTNTKQNKHKIVISLEFWAALWVKITFHIFTTLFVNLIYFHSKPCEVSDILIPFHRYENWGPKRWNYTPKVILLLSGRIGTWAPRVWLLRPCPYCCSVPSPQVGAHRGKSPDLAWPAVVILIITIF